MPVPPDPPSAVVFDIGGVLLDWDPRYLYRKLLPDEPAVTRFLAEVCTQQWNAEQDRGRPWEQAVAQLSARFPAQAALIAAYHHRWEETVGGAIDGTVAVLRDLRDQRVPCYALTNFSAEKFRLVRARFGFLGWLSGAVVSGDERVIKPDPRIYRILLDRFDLDPARTVYVDDVPANVAAARALGMPARHFTDPVRLRADLAALGLLNVFAHHSCAKPAVARTHAERK